MTPVVFHYDFISPYSYLALAGAEDFAREHGVEWRLRPIVYAKVLEATGLIGPAETPAKRAYTYADALRSARVAGVPLVGPPAHPFRSLEALRLATLYRDHEKGLAFSVRLATACWGEGRDLTDPAELDALRADCGLLDRPLAEALQDPGAKQSLRESTTEAVEAGVFGVPSFRVGEELFWGHDRMEHLGAFLSGGLPPAHEDAEALLARPQAVRRRLAEDPS